MQKVAFFNTITAISLIFAVFYSANALAQRELDIDEIQVVAPYEPSISDAFKINLDPTIEDTVTVDMDFDYRIEPRRAYVRFEPNPITPARMRGEPLTKLYRGLVKGGYGSYQSPYFEGFYNTLRSDEYALGVHLKHRSSGEDIDNFPNSTFSRNKANVYGTRFYDNHALKADVTYNRHMLHFYGEPFGLTMPEKNDQNDSLWDPFSGGTRQRYEFLSSEVSFGNYDNDPSGFTYNTGLQHQWLSDRYDGSEHLFRLHGNIGSPVTADPFGVMEKQHFQLEADARYYYHHHVADTLHTGIYSLKPKLHSAVDRLDFYLGANVSVEDDNGNFTLRAYPLAGVNVQIIPDNLIAGVDVSGGLKKQSWQELSESNPFVSPLPGTGFSNVRSDIGLGVHGALGNSFSYNLRINNSQIDNYPFFARTTYPDPGLVPEALDEAGFMPNQPFHVVYDDIRKLQVTGELFYRFGERVSMHLRGDYYDYTLDELQKAWHKPEFELSFSTNYNIQDKIILTAEVLGRDKTYGALYTTGEDQPQEFELHDLYADVNLGIEYRYSKRLSVFLNFSNIVNDEYERWLGYPTQGFNFLGGMSFAF